MSQNPAQKQLIEKFHNRTAVIGVVGLGYVGLPLAIRFAEEGFRVLGLDIDAQKVTKLNQGQSYIKHIPNSQVSGALAKKFSATGEFSRGGECDALIICVPTPLSEHREPDLSFITQTMDSLVPFLRKGQVVSLESTTYPGTTEEELLPRMAKAGFKVGTDSFLLFSPEREDPGNPKFSTRSIPKVVGGLTPACLEVGTALYGAVIDKVVPVSSLKVAELSKLLENIHRAVNIGLVNEMKIVADKMGVNIHEVIRAASSKPFGFTPYYPGPGLGGHCIPIDPFYLTWKAREYGVHTRFIELAGEVNSAMPEWVVSKIADALNDRSKSIKGSKILVLGIAYKKNVDDMRESPSVALMELLTAKGASIQYSDPYIPVFPKLRKHFFELTSEAITADSLKKYDCVLVATNHDDFDYELIRKNAPLIVDTRGVYDSGDKHIVKA